MRTSFQHIIKEGKDFIKLFLLMLCATSVLFGLITSLVGKYTYIETQEVLLDKGHENYTIYKTETGILLLTHGSANGHILYEHEIWADMHS